MDDLDLPSSSHASASIDQLSISHFHRSHHNIEIFGRAEDLNLDLLPTNGDILRYYFFEFERCYNAQLSYKNFTSHVTDKVIEIWRKLPMELLQRKSIFNKLNALVDSYRKVTKRTKLATKFEEFVNSLKNLFNIAKCKCNLIILFNCTCGNTPLILKSFMVDQQTDRQKTISEFIETLPQPTIPITIEIPEDLSDPC